jgi:hypothetical protein
LSTDTAVVFELWDELDKKIGKGGNCGEGERLIQDQKEKKLT